MSALLELEDKVNALVAGAEFDVCGNECGMRAPLHFVHRAAVPGHGTVNLFKVLLTNVCMNDCAYCVNQIGRDVPRTAFRPEELAKTFTDMLSRRVVSGLFLTSGIAGSASRTMEGMIKTVQILRQRHRYRGYVHLKILPGAPFDCVEEACRIADRVSVNMEAPSAEHLVRLSRKKDLHGDILERMGWVKKLTTADRALAPSGQTTQFVVGAAGDTDEDLLRTTSGLYRDLGLRRVYFSAFRPVSHSRLEGVPPAPPLRQHRLYQADWLLRVYGFSPGEVQLALGRDRNLSLAKDPKLVIAAKQPWLFPVDINRAGYDELLRVPGVGPISARRIVEVRGRHSVGSLEELGKLGVVIGQARPFVWFKGMAVSPRQSSFLSLLDDGVEATP